MEGLIVALYLLSVHLQAFQLRRQLIYQWVSIGLWNSRFLLNACANMLASRLMHIGHGVDQILSKTGKILTKAQKVRVLGLMFSLWCLAHWTESCLSMRDLLSVSKNINVYTLGLTIIDLILTKSWKSDYTIWLSHISSTIQSFVP